VLTACLAKHKTLQGTAGQLRQELEGYAKSDLKGSLGQYWPTSEKAFGNALRQLMKPLRFFGYRIEETKFGNNRRFDIRNPEPEFVREANAEIEELTAQTPEEDPFDVSPSKPKAADCTTCGAKGTVTEQGDSATCAACNRQEEVIPF
jgi:hypothetical protein